MHPQGFGALRLYLCLAFGASLLASVATALTGGRHSPHAMLLALSVMLAPAAAALISARVKKEPFGEVGWRRLPVGFFVLGLFTLPVLLHIAAFGFCFATYGGIPWDAWLTPGPDGLYHPPASANMGATAFGPDVLALKLIAKAAVNLLIVTVFAFGEELGWRVFMQPRLVSARGELKGVLWSSVIWALWHIPYAISGLHEIPSLPLWVGPLVFPWGHLGYGLFLGWLWQRSRSVWVVAFAHGATNNWGGFALKFINPTLPAGAATRYALLLVLATRAAFLVPGLFCLWLLRPSRAKGEP